MGKKIIFTIILVIFSIVLPLVIFEGCLRVFYPQQESMRWFKSSSKYGYVLKENFSQDYSYIKHKFTMHVQTNSLGHRYKEYNIANFNNPKYKKVLLLGDSFMFGQGVNMEDHIATHLENMLNKSGNPFLLINAGVGGWGTLQEISYAKDNFQLFNPDFIILLFCFNDPDDDNKFLANMADHEKGVFYFPGKIFLRNHSHLYRFIFYRLHYFLNKVELKKRSKNNENIILNEKGTDTIIPKQWERTLKVIKEFYTEYIEFNPKGILMILTTNPWNENHRKKLGSLSNGQNLLFIDLYDDTISIPEKERLLEYDRHWSKLIHYISAMKISESILKHTVSIK